MSGILSIVLFATFILLVCTEGPELPEIEIDGFLEMENEMITKMKSYISRERDRLSLLKKHLQEWKDWRSTYASDESKYITVPGNLFHLFKRLTHDFNKLEKIMLKNSYNDTMANDDIKPPTDNHLKSVMLSLVNMQYSYDLDPIDIMNGKLLGFSANTTLAEETCFFIGETCLEYNKHGCAIDWLNACMSVTSDKEKIKKVYKLLYPSYLFFNDKEQAFKYAEYYINFDPLDVPASDVRLATGKELGKLNPIDYSMLESYRLCRGDYNKLISNRILKCRYNHENSPFLKIAPLKEEQVYDNPVIIIYREAIYDAEIERMKSMAMDKLSTATVFGNDGKSRVTGFIYRISQTAFIDNHTPSMSQLTARISDISQLSLNGSEYWQVINYSPGGFYRVHADYLPTQAEVVQKFGNRMTSLLFYLNDVPLGGATVFPNIRVAVTPEKGSVVVWHNVNPDLSEDVNAQHCACPVIIGEKWAFTQWIRTVNQRSLRHLYDRRFNEPKTKNIDHTIRKKNEKFGNPRKKLHENLIDGISQL